jgi:hypothetical protein
MRTAFENGEHRHHAAQQLRKPLPPEPDACEGVASVDPNSFAEARASGDSGGGGNEEYADVRLDDILGSFFRINLYVINK